MKLTAITGLLGSWQGMAIGGAAVFLAGSAIGAKAGSLLERAELAPQLATAQAQIAAHQAEKANTATAALNALNQLALDAQASEAAAEQERQEMETARQAFNRERRLNVSQGSSTVCTVSSSDAASGRLLDARLFPED